MRRTDIYPYLDPTDHTELEVLRTHSNRPRKLAWRAGIILAGAAASLRDPVEGDREDRAGEAAEFHALEPCDDG